MLPLLFWIPVVFFSLLLAHNAMLYFAHGGEYGILTEKLEARKDLLWNICFYIHLPSGVVCLLTPLYSFSRRYFKKGINQHIIAGKIYLWTSLLLVCPTGMYLALYAKGGVAAQAGFMAQGILLAYFTYQGYETIKKGSALEHVHYMIRSYAAAAAVLSFRILHILFFVLKVPYQDNYAISQWLGLTLNLLVAELIIMITLTKNTSTKTQSL